MMRKNTLIAIALALTASTLAATPAFAFDADFTPGDLILGVQSSSSTRAPNDWSGLNPVSGSTQGVGFSTFVGGIQHSFASGSFDNGAVGGLTGVERVVDLYRIARFSNALPGLSPIRPRVLDPSLAASQSLRTVMCISSRLFLNLTPPFSLASLHSPVSAFADAWQ